MPRSRRNLLFGLFGFFSIFWTIKYQLRVRGFFPFSHLEMIPELWTCIFSLFFFYVHGAKLPEPEVKIEVSYKPFLCHRKSKYGDMLLVHYEGFLESNGTMFHSR